MQQGMTEELYRHVDSYRDSDEFDAAEKMAIEYAERFVFEHRELDATFFDRMRTHFDDRQILELTVLIGFCVGIGRTLAVLDIANDCELNLAKEPIPGP